MPFLHHTEVRRKRILASFIVPDAGVSGRSWSVEDANRRQPRLRRLPVHFICGIAAAALINLLP